MLSLPFSSREFFDVFGRYNSAVWPAALVLWLAALAALAVVVTGPRPTANRAVGLVLVALWVWGGAVYHAVFFTAVNPAAWFFALLFLIEAGLLLRFGVWRRQLAFRSAPNVQATLGIGLALYALAYPGLTLLLGHRYPQMPTFGVPCPTTIYTVGLLLTLERRPLALMIIPFVWSIIGGSAAVLLGVTTDYVLLAGAGILAVDASLAGQRRG